MYTFYKMWEVIAQRRTAGLESIQGCGKWSVFEMRGFLYVVYLSGPKLGRSLEVTVWSEKLTNYKLTLKGLLFTTKCVQEH